MSSRSIDALGVLGVMFTFFQTRYLGSFPVVGTTIGMFGGYSVYAGAIFAYGYAILRIFHEKAWREGFAMLMTLGCGLGIGWMLWGGAWALFSFNVLGGVGICVDVFLRYRKRMFLGLFLAISISLVCGVFQMVMGYFPPSTIAGIAERSAEHLGDAIILFHGERVLRMYGLFPHPNIFGVVLSVVCVLWMVFGDHTKRSGRILQGFFAISCVPIALVISRTGALALFLGIVAQVIAPQRRMVALFVAGVVITFIAMSSYGLAREPFLLIRGDESHEVRSLSERDAQWEVWWNLVTSRGYQGVGIGRYPERLAEYLGGDLPAWEYQPIHNVPALLFAEIGAIPMVLVVFFGFWLAVAYREKFVMHAPIFVAIWTLAWFDHGLWTSWTGCTMLLSSIAMSIADAGDN